MWMWVNLVVQQHVDQDTTCSRDFSERKNKWQRKWSTWFQPVELFWPNQNLSLAANHFSALCPASEIPGVFISGKTNTVQKILNIKRNGVVGGGFSVSGNISKQWEGQIVLATICVTHTVKKCARIRQGFVDIYEAARTSRLAHPNSRICAHCWHLMRL